ncbi:MAG: ORF6N domain-containing protein [Neisseriaceae bacterium]|jgi:predicted amidohydrolase YtcJ
MSEIVTLNKTVEDKIIHIRNQKVLLDSVVAELYGIETKRVNEAVSRNPDKFPEGYLIELTAQEWGRVKPRIATSPTPLGGGKVKLPKAFTEKGLYMLATILKSSRATATTIAIVETFTKVREATRSVAELLESGESDKETEKLNQKVGNLISEIMMPNEADFETESIKTTAKFKLFSVLEFSKEITKKPKK